MRITKTDNSDIVQFVDDDSYLSWALQHPDCYTLTSNKSLTPRHTVIHHADCRLILELKGNSKPGGFTRDYIKVAADHPSKLHHWARRQRADAEARVCSVCAVKRDPASP